MNINDVLHKRFYPSDMGFCRLKLEPRFQPKTGVTGFELAAELERVVKARAELDKLERNIQALLGEALMGGGSIIAYGTVEKGELEVRYIEDWTEKSFETITRHQDAVRFMLPLHSEAEVSAWEMATPKWGFKRSGTGYRDCHENYRTADSYENVGYPTPLFNEEQVAAWKAGKLESKDVRIPPELVEGKPC